MEAPVAHFRVAVEVRSLNSGVLPVRAETVVLAAEAVEVHSRPTEVMASQALEDSGEDRARQFQIANRHPQASAAVEAQDSAARSQSLMESLSSKIVRSQTMEHTVDAADSPTSNRIVVSVPKDKDMEMISSASEHCRV